MTLDNLVVLNETLQIPKLVVSMSVRHSFLKSKPPSRNRKKLDQNVVIYPIHIQRLIWSFTQIKNEPNTQPGHFVIKRSEELSFQVTMSQKLNCQQNTAGYHSNNNGCRLIFCYEV